MPDASVSYFASLKLTFWHGAAGYLALALFAGLRLWLVGWIAQQLLPSAQATGLFGRINHLLEGSGLRIPLAWVAVEVIIYQPVPWFFAAPVIALQPLAQSADLFGVPFVTLLILWIANLARQLFGVRSSNKGTAGFRYRDAVILAALIVLIWGYGTLRSTQLDSLVFSARKLNLTVVQGNSPIINRPTDQQIGEQLEHYLTLSAQADNESELIVWPEASSPRPIHAGVISYRPDFGRRAPTIKKPLIFAGKLLDTDPHNGEMGYFVSANLLLPDGTFNAAYQKRWTVLLAEDIPFRHQLPWLEKIFGPRQFLRGRDNPAPILVPIVMQPVSIATVICFEDLVPEAFQSLFKRGPVDLLLALTNEKWFDGTLAQQQHSMLAAWRAVENGRFMVRATTSGETSVTSPKGEIKLLVAPQQAAIANLKAPLLQHRTVFSRFGEAPIKLLCWLVILYTLATIVRKSFLVGGVHK